MVFFYNVGIRIYYWLILIASIKNPKAKKWIVGRKKIIDQIQSVFANETNVVWFHCASLGEFEQGRPVIEKLKSNSPDIKIVLTFYSPSGYEIRKEYAFADFVFYLPLDTRKNARAFIDAVKPKFVVFVKYEFWYHFINELHLKNIPLYIISAHFRENQHFFQWYGVWFRNLLQKVNHIFVQTNESLALLEKINIKNASLSGDTRFDRVFELAHTNESIASIEKFKSNNPVFIAGSTWQEDEDLIVKFISGDKTGFKYIIAPHEINGLHSEKLIATIPDAVLLSQLEISNGFNKRVLIIDSVGLLSKIYKYGSVAYIGGGFGKGIHNSLEPAAFGLPVLFGPNYGKFQEATDLIAKGGAFSVSNELDVKTVMRLLSDDLVLKMASEIAKNYVYQHKGATDKIISFLRGNNPVRKFSTP